jgi:predicted Zn-dependent protease
MPFTAFCAAGLFFAALSALTTCETMDAVGSDVLGGLAAAGASALGAGKEVAGAIGAGVGTFAESSKAARELTPENEYYIGRAVAANLTVRYKVYNENPALRQYLNKICDTIVINSAKPEIFNGYHVAILDTGEINAFATSGGHIFITRGLIACTANEDELASVLAHEIAHIQLQHGLTAIRNARYLEAAKSGVLAGISAGAGSDIADLANVLNDSVGEIITTMVNNGYAKDQEFQADTTALSLLASAGYEPSSIVEMLHSLEKNQKSGSGFGKTHPSPQNRIANVNKGLGKYKVPDTREYRKRRFGEIRL